MINIKMKNKRLELGYSQAELAKLTNVSRQTINMIENKDYNPSLSLCISIARSLEMTLDELFWEDKNDYWWKNWRRKN